MSNTHFYVMLIISLCFVPFLVSGQSNIIITLDEGGVATFLGNGTNYSALPEGVLYKNGTIEGSTSTLTKKNDETWSFSFFLRNSSLEVYLPEAAVVKDLEGELSVNDRQQIKVYANNTIKVSYVLPTESLLALANKKKNDIFLLSVIFAGLIAGILIFGREYLHKQLQVLTKKKRPNKEKDTNKKFTLITQLLNSKENQILSILRERGPMKSSYLQRMSQIPKSSFFRNLQELEKKRLITRFGGGRNKIINLNIK